MEFLDVLDENGNKTGRTAARGEKLHPGEHCLAVHIWIGNVNGGYLIQKRSEDREFCPGMWAVTSGMVAAGESSLDAALREANEEIGVRLRPEELCFSGRFRWMEWFADVYLADRDIPLESIAMQEEEVSAVRWASIKEIKAMAARGEFVNYSYLDRL